MSYDYDEKGLVEGAASEEEPLAEAREDKKKAPAEEEYNELPDSPDARTRVRSVISLFASVVSVLLCSLYYLSLPLAAFGIICAILSRRKLGYFDGLSVAGLLVGVVGAVFGTFSLVISVTGVLDALKK